MKDVIVNQDTVYQWRRVYIRENKSGVCPTLTANMGEGGHNVPIVRTSPDHGTAYDMAGRDEADPHSMMSSIFTAIDIFKSRQAYDALQAGKMNKEK